MSGSGRGGNRRRSKRRDRDTEYRQGGAPGGNPAGTPGGASPSVSRQGKKAGEGVQNQNSRENFRYDRGRGGFYERPKWSPPKLSSEPIPSPECPYCGKPIRDLSAALNDRASGEPVHFDCVIARLGESEALDRGDALAYIGGGRFGVVRFAGPQEPRNFKIKRILEWEDKENRALWRRDISDHYSLT